MQSKSKLIFFISALFGLTTYCQATEQDELALVIKQMEQIKQSLIRSEIVSSTDKVQRYHFNYRAVEDDLNQIIQGIEKYLSPERAQPRLNLPPIKGNYINE